MSFTQCKRSLPDSWKQEAWLLNYRVVHVNRYYYLKEKMENRCVLDSNMVFDNQWYEGEMYKWRLRYRFEYGYRIDDCYRYDYQKEKFVK